MIIIGSPKGTLEEKFERLMAQAGLPVAWDGYQGKVEHSQVSKVIKMRPKDIAQSVALGELDLGVTGQDCISELGLNFGVVELGCLPLCRSGRQAVELLMFARDDTDISAMLDLARRGSRKIKIATEYPNITKQFLAINRYKADIRATSGATESLVRAGFVDAGIDVVDTGLSLQQNHLRVIASIMTSKTVLISNDRSMADQTKEKAIRGISHLLLEAAQSPQSSGPDFAKRNGLITAIVQDYESREVLMHAYMDRTAWQKTLAEKRLYRYSTSAKRVMLKGETSGNLMEVQDVYLDCDRDACLVLVKVSGSQAACHTGNRTCFFEKVID